MAAAVDCAVSDFGSLDLVVSTGKSKIAGSSDVLKRAIAGERNWSRAPVTEQYLMAAPPEWNKGWGVKTLFQYDPEFWKLGIHRPKMKTRHLKTDFPDCFCKDKAVSGRPPTVSGRTKLFPEDSRLFLEA